MKILELLPMKVKASLLNVCFKRVRLRKDNPIVCSLLTLRPDENSHIPKLAHTATFDENVISKCKFNSHLLQNSI